MKVKGFAVVLILVLHVSEYTPVSVVNILFQHPFPLPPQ